MEQFDQCGALDAIRSKLFSCSLVAHSWDSSNRLQQLLEKGLELLSGALDYDVASVYLLNNRGRLERIATLSRKGYCKLGRIEIEKPDSLLEGCRRPIERSSGNTDPLLCSYEEVLGTPVSLIRLPLNGSSRIIGFLELARRGGIFSLIESESSEARTACSIVASIAGSITLFRSRNESVVLASFSQLLAESQASETQGELEARLTKALQIIIDGLDDYAAAVLRVITSGEALKICARAGDPRIDWTRWRDMDFSRGEYLAGQVLQRNQAISVSDIEEQQHLFANLDWVRDNELKSCACYPLVVRGEPVGTFSIFCGFPYRFSDFDNDVLKGFANGFALRWDRFLALRTLEALRQDVDDIRVEAARVVTFRKTQSYLHNAKNTIIEAVLRLRKTVNSGLPDQKRAAVERVIDLLTSEEARLSGPPNLGSDSRRNLELNEKIREIVQWKQIDRRDQNISVRFDFGEVPVINLRDGELLELLDNLLSNSVRAIRQANRKVGEIVITTGRTTIGLRDAVEISVRDNGRGFPKDLKDRIFDPGFTTNKDIGGTGLGLFLVKSIVLGYEGEVYCESRFGDGATFGIRLPLDCIGV
jgi:GAF domain-containing protein